MITLNILDIKRASGIVENIPKELSEILGQQKYILGPNNYDTEEKGLILRPYDELEYDMNQLDSTRMSPSRKRHRMRVLYSPNHDAEIKKQELFVPYRLIEHLGMKENGQYILEAMVVGNKILLYSWHLFSDKL